MAIELTDRVPLRLMPRRTPQAPPWPTFVWAALAFTLTAGSLTGALDLWSLRAGLRAVPVDHHRAHGIAQLFGLFGLFIMGVSLHLAPRFFNAAPPTRRVTVPLTWCGVGGVALLVVGRFGALVPGSAALGVLGALALTVAMSTWAFTLWRFWAGLSGPKSTLHQFVLAGAGWWWAATVTLLMWQLGQTFGGPGTAVPLEAIWAPALFGGTASWLWGIFLRAGVCTLHVTPPSVARQRRLFWAWQAATVTTVLSAWAPSRWLEAAASVTLVVAVAAVWHAIRPFSGQAFDPDEAVQPRALQACFVFLVVFGALHLWHLAGVFGAPTPPLLRDAARHAFTLGTATLALFGFAGRMVPGFRGVSLRWPRLYAVGIVLVTTGATLRLAELVGTGSALAVAGGSGGFAFAGIGLVSASLLGSLRAHRAALAA